jgi:hypothetical protein
MTDANSFKSFFAIRFAYANCPSEGTSHISKPLGQTVALSSEKVSRRKCEMIKSVKDREFWLFPRRWKKRNTLCIFQIQEEKGK